MIIKRNYLLNDEITTLMVRIKTEGQTELLTKEDALKRASEEGKDLIQLTVENNVAICKIIKDDKFRYEQKIFEKSKIKKAPILKQVKFSLNIQKDAIETKKRSLINFLKSGHPIKLTLRLKKREMKGDFAERAKKILQDVADSLSRETMIKIDHPANFDLREASIGFVPIKK